MFNVSDCLSIIFTRDDRRILDGRFRFLPERTAVLIASNTFANSIAPIYIRVSLHASFRSRKSNARVIDDKSPVIEGAPCSIYDSDINSAQRFNSANYQSRDLSGVFMLENKKAGETLIVKL
jgi:hypothetical protein